MKRTLALDFGKRWGWCLGDLDGEHGWKQVAWDRRGWNYYEYFNWLKKKIEIGFIERIVHEKVVTMGYQQQAGVLVLGGMYAFTEMIAATKGIEVIDVAPATLKKFIAGNGRAKKPEVIEAVRHVPGFGAVEDDNEADACAAWLWAKAKGKE